MHEKHTYFCAQSAIFLPFLIIRLTGSCHSLSLSHVTVLSRLSYRMKSTRRFLVLAGGARPRAVPYRRARQHSTRICLLGRLFRGMHMLFSEAKSQVSKIPKAWKGNPKPEITPTLRTGGNQSESVSYRTAWCFWDFLLELTDGNPYRTCTTGETRRLPGHPSFEAVAHSPAAAEGCTHQFASFQVGEETSN